MSAGSDVAKRFGVFVPPAAPKPERTEGWGVIMNATKAHYFTPDMRSLCKRWLAFNPLWDKRQDLGDAPDRGTCTACWRARAKIEEAAKNQAIDDKANAAAGLLVTRKESRT